ncbi:minichromosome maintenance protein 10 [Monosporozyma servazzii]
MNLDPRDIITADPYTNITSDEDEETQIEKELQEMERRKKDLEMRLKEKKQKDNKKDPNFICVQVPGTPEKKKVSTFSEEEMTISKVEPDESVIFNTGENINESKFVNSQPVLQPIQGSSSYFIDRFENSKKKEKLKIQAHENMMSTRVHTFGSNPLKEYKPIIVDELDEYSGISLTKRYIPVNILKETLQDIKLLRLNKLFAKIRPPKFEEPQYSNWAVLGIISQKSEVKYTSSAKPQKFIKLTLTNFKQQIDVFIFGDSGVKKYITLRVGDVIAILNPEILPWKPSSGREAMIKSFNLKIAHKYNCILEIGRSRDIGYCPIWNKATNSKCGNCIDTSIEKCCEYHREIQMRSSNAKRLDLNGGFSMGAPTKVGVQPTIYREESNNKYNDRNLPNGNNNTNKRKYSSSGGNKRLPSFNLMSRSTGYNNQREEDLKKKSLTARHFSNNKAAKAFFDDDYHNPDMINNLDSKRRKIQDSKRSNKLDKMLNKMLHRDINLNDKSSTEIDKLKTTTDTVLQSGIMQRLGFDPTHGKVASVLKSKKFSLLNSKLDRDDLPKDKPSNMKKKVVDELLLFKKDSVNLASSTVYKMERKAHRRAAWKEAFGKNDGKIKPGKEFDDGDSDLEII